MLLKQKHLFRNECHCCGTSGGGKQGPAARDSRVAAYAQARRLQRRKDDGVEASVTGSDPDQTQSSDKGTRDVLIRNSSASSTPRIVPQHGVRRGGGSPSIKSRRKTVYVDGGNSGNGREALSQNAISHSVRGRDVLAEVMGKSRGTASRSREPLGPNFWMESEHRLPSMQSPALVSLLVGLAHRQECPPQQWTSHYFHSICRYLVRLSPNHLSQLLWAMAKLRMTLTSTQKRELVEATTGRLGEFSLAGLSNSCWALAMMSAPVSPRWWQAFMAATKPRLALMAPHQLSQTLWAIGKLRPAQHVTESWQEAAAAAVLHHLKGHLLATTNSASALILTNFLWGLAHCSFSPSPEWCQSARGAVCAQSDYLDSQNLVNVIHSLARLGITVHLGLKGCLLNQLDAALPGLSSHSLVDVCWALAVLGWDISLAMKDNLYRSLTLRLRTLHSEQATRVLWSLAKMQQATGESGAGVGNDGARLALAWSDFLMDPEEQSESRNTSPPLGSNNSKESVWLSGTTQPGYGQSAVPESTQVKLISDLLTTCLQDMRMWSPSVLTSSLWAATELAVAPDDAWMSNWEAATAKQLPCFSLLQLATVITQLAHLRYRPTQLWLDACFRQLESILGQADNRPTGVSGGRTGAASTVTLDTAKSQAPTSNCSRAANQPAGQAGTTTGTASPGARGAHDRQIGDGLLVDLLRSLALLRLYPPSSVSQLLQVHLTLVDGHQLTAYQLVDLLWAAGLLRLVAPGHEFTNQAMYHLGQRLHDCDAMSLCRALEALAWVSLVRSSPADDSSGALLPQPSLPGPPLGNPLLGGPAGTSASTQGSAAGSHDLGLAGTQGSVNTEAKGDQEVLRRGGSATSYLTLPVGQNLLRLLVEEVETFLPVLGPTLLTSYLWSLAVLRVDLPGSYAESIVRAAEELLPKMRLEELTQTAWALTSLDLPLSERWQECWCEHLTGRITSLKQLPHLGRRPPVRCYSNALWVVAKWQGQGGFTGPPELLTLCLTEAEAAAEMYDAASLGSLLWAIATMKLRVSLELLDRLYDAFLLRLPTAPSYALSNVLWASGVLGYRLSGPRAQALVDAVELLASLMSSHEYLQVLGALAKMEADVSDSWMLYMTECAVLLLDSFRPHELAGVMSSFVELGISPGDPFMRQLYCVSRPRLILFNGSSLSTLLWALAQMTPRISSRGWLHALLLQLRRRLPSLSCHEVALVGLGLVMLKVKLARRWLVAFKDRVLRLAPYFSSQDQASVLWAMSHLTAARKGRARMLTSATLRNNKRTHLHIRKAWGRRRRRVLGDTRRQFKMVVGDGDLEPPCR